MSTLPFGFRSRGLPTSAATELGREHRRTRLVRLVLATLALGLLVASIVASRDLHALPTSYFASGSGGVVVLDLSTSVDELKGQRAQRVLRSLAETEGRVGLVVFSDSAYEMLPPDTRSEELRPLLRFIAPPPGFDRTRFGFRNRRNDQPLTQQRPEESPWSLSFRGGTRISTGLAEARSIITREGNKNLSVLLLSDLDDSGFDTSALVEELDTYEQSGIRLRVIPLFPAQEDLDLFTRIAGRDTLVERPELLRNTSIKENLTLVGSSPWLLVWLAAGLLCLLALNERFCAGLGWRRAA